MVAAGIRPKARRLDAATRLVGLATMTVCLGAAIVQQRK